MMFTGKLRGERSSKVMAYRRIEPGEFTEAIIEELLDRLSHGESMKEICSDPRMPDRETIRRWAERDDELAASIMRARECGYLERGEKAVEDAKNAIDPVKGRLAFDAERWYLGKLSRAFAEKPVQVETKTTVKLDADDIFGQFTGALERAAAALASGARGTIKVADDSEAGTGSA